MNSYTSISKKKEKRIVRSIFFTTIGLLIIVFLFNIFINPYGHAYFKVDHINSENITKLNNKEKFKLLKDGAYEFNSYVIGSSQVSRIYSEDLDKYSNDSWITFPISASMASEHYHYMDYFDKNYKIKNIIYGLDMDNFFGTYLYRGNTVMKDKKDYSIFDYFTFDTIKKSTDKIKYNNTYVENNNNEPDTKYKYFNGWKDANITQKELDQILTTAKPTYIKDSSKRETIFLNVIENQFNKNIIPIITYYHPYTMLMKRKDNYKYFVFNMISIFKEVWQINPKYIDQTIGPYYYKNGEHTNRAFGLRIIKSIYGKDDFFIKINKNTYENVVDTMYESICKHKYKFHNYMFSHSIECN